MEANVYVDGSEVFELVVAPLLLTLTFWLPTRSGFGDQHHHGGLIPREVVRLPSIHSDGVCVNVAPFNIS